MGGDGGREEAGRVRHAPTPHRFKLAHSLHGIGFKSTP